MKILFYSPHPTHDIVSEVGYATHQRETIIALQGLGVEVIPVILGGVTLSEMPFKDGKALEPKGIKGVIKKIIPRFVWLSLKNFDLFAKHDFKARMRLEKAVIEHSPDLLYERSEYLQDSGTKVAQKYGIKHFIEVNAPFVEEMRAMEGWHVWQWLAHFKEKKKYRAADRVFVVSTVLKDFLVKRYKVNPAKILVSPNRINEKSFLLKAQSPTKIQVSFRDAAPLVGFVGSILPHHHLDIMIDVFAKLNKENVDVNLLIVGGGSLLDELKRQAEEKGLRDRIHFTDRVPHQDIPALIQTMDICVMPASNWYGSPVKIFEYGIMGKAVVAPDNGPVSDVMVDNEDGLLVQNNVDEIATAITKLVKDIDLRHRLGEHFRQKIIQGFTWRHAAEMILKEANK